MSEKKEAAANDEKVQGAANEEVTGVEASEEELVTIKLFKDSGKYKDDVFVSRNGVNYQIQRGIEVQVPKGIAEIIENSDRMDQQTANKIAAAVAKAAQAARE